MSLRSPRVWILVAAITAVVSGCNDDHRTRRADPPDASALGGADAGSDSIERRQTLATSATHSCALRKSGLYCWGENFLGQLGNGGTIESESAVAATAAGTDVVDIAVSTGRTCVRRSTGEVACLGANDQGQIGDGTRNDALTAVVAVDIDDAVQLAIDDGSTCILRRDHSVACWGNSPASSPTSGSLVPTEIAGLSRVVELTGGGFGGYCAREESGAVRCWHFEEGKWTTPEEVVELREGRSLVMSHQQTVCAVVPDDEIVCRRTDSGDVIVLEDSAGYVQKISAGNLVACAINLAGRGRCWNVHPQFVLDVPSDAPLLELTVSGLSACMLREDKRVMCLKAGDLMPVPFDVPLPD